MKKYKLRNGEEIKVGDTLISKRKSINKEGDVLYTIRTKYVTKDFLESLVKSKQVDVIDDERNDLNHDTSKDSTINMDMNFYVHKVMEKIKCRTQEQCDMLNNINNYYLPSTLSLVIREIALELDRKYPDHISDSETVYAISMLNGKITRVDRKSIKNFRNFAAFRTLEDAKTACKIVSPYLRMMFRDKDVKH